MFAVLTHIDAYTPEGDDDSDSEEEDGIGTSAAADQRAVLESSAEDGPASSARKSPLAAGEVEFDREAELPGIVSLW